MPQRKSLAVLAKVVHTLGTRADWIGLFWIDCSSMGSYCTMEIRFWDQFELFVLPVHFLAKMTFVWMQKHSALVGSGNVKICMVFVKLFIFIFFTSIGKNLCSLDRSFALVLPAKNNTDRIPGTPSFCSVFGREQGQMCSHRRISTLHMEEEIDALWAIKMCLCVLCWQHGGDFLRKQPSLFQSELLRSYI